MFDYELEILNYIKKEKRDRVKFELNKNREMILYKFADIDRYFDLKKCVQDLTKFSSNELINFFKSKNISLKNAYILSNDDKYDKGIFNITEIIIEELFEHAFPSIILLKDNYMFVIGEYSVGAYSPKYLFKLKK